MKLSSSSKKGFWCKRDKELSGVGIAMMIERSCGDERTKRCIIHVEKNWPENGSLGYATSKWKGGGIESEVGYKKSETIGGI